MDRDEGELCVGKLDPLALTLAQHPARREQRASREQTEAILRRAGAAIQKRHRVIHDS
jgi:predicted component of type VI protein secretion system